MFNSKNANIAAMIVMSIVLISTIGLYFSENFVSISPNSVSSYKEELTLIENSIKTSILSSSNIVLNNGFSNSSRIIFENLPYSPTFDEYINYLNQTLNKVLVQNFKNLENSENSMGHNFNYSNYNLNIIKDYNNNILIINIDNLTYQENKKNFLIKKNLNYSVDLSEDLKLFKVMSNWNNIDSPYFMQNLLNSFQGSCGITCDCTGFQGPVLQPTNLNNSKILNLIDSHIKNLSSKLMDINSTFDCSYQILFFETKNNEAYEYQIPPSGGTPVCDKSKGTSSSFSTILKSDKKSIIDSTTISYNISPEYYYIKRNNTNKSSILNFQYEANDLTPLAKNSAPSGIGPKIQKKILEPSFISKIEIACTDNSRTININGFTSPITASFGFRINVFKKCMPIPQISSQDKFQSCGSSFDCMSYTGCHGTGAYSADCITNSTEYNPKQCKISPPGPCDVYEVLPWEEECGDSYIWMEDTTTCETGRTGYKCTGPKTKHCPEADEKKDKSENVELSRADFNINFLNNLFLNTQSFKNMLDPCTIAGQGCPVDPTPTLPKCYFSCDKPYEEKEVCYLNGKKVPEPRCVNGVSSCVKVPDGCVNKKPECVSCFTKGTKVSMFDGSLKNIEDVKIGDIVQSYNVKTSKLEFSKVLELESPIRDHYYNLIFEDNSFLNLTGEHPLYIKKGLYIGWGSVRPDMMNLESYILNKTPFPNLQKIEIGTKVFSKNSWKSVLKINYVSGNIQTYNLKEIEGNHDFFVNGFLAHNKVGEIKNPPSPQCGDGKCELGESPCSCSSDCSGTCVISHPDPITVNPIHPGE